MCGVSHFIQKHHTIVAAVVTTVYEVGCNAAADVETVGTGALVCAGSGGAIYGWLDNQLDPNADHSFTGTLKSMAINTVVAAGTYGILKGGGRLAKPVARAVSRAVTRAGARAGARAVGARAARKAVSDAGDALSAACGHNSFAAATLVLMANGTSKPIAQIKVGDKITNAVPGTDLGTPGQAHTVTDVHITYDDHDYTDVTVATTKGPRTITGTSHHLYWNTTTRAWTPADHLHAGDHLQTTDGQSARITALRTYTATMVTYNLTIDGLHTYYVEAGNTPVLVHNCGDGEPVKLYRSPGEGNRASESRGLSVDNHEGPHPTAYLANKPEGAAQYAGNGHDPGFHVFTMKPGFREAFGDLEFPLPNKDGVEGLTEWRIPAHRFDEFNSYIDHPQTEWWDSMNGWFFPSS